MKNGNMKVCVCGNFGSGKKSVINALLGKRILKISATPCYYANTLELIYAESPRVEFELGKGNNPRKAIQQEYSLFDNEFETGKYNSNHIDELKIFYPIDSLKGIEILLLGTLDDNPGPYFDITKSKYASKLAECDVVIYVMNVCYCWTMEDLRKLQILQNMGIKNIIVVLTHWDFIDKTDYSKVLHFCNENINKFCISQDLCFCVNGYKAMQAIEQNDTEAYSKTGFPEFERFLTNYYIKLRSEEKK